MADRIVVNDEGRYYMTGSGFMSGQRGNVGDAFFAPLLEKYQSFSYRRLYPAFQCFTGRLELRRGKPYWYGYKNFFNGTVSAYIGKTSSITSERLTQVLEQLLDKGLGVPIEREVIEYFDELEQLRQEAGLEPMVNGRPQLDLFEKKILEPPSLPATPNYSKCPACDCWVWDGPRPHQIPRFIREKLVHIDCDGKTPIDVKDIQLHLTECVGGGVPLPLRPNKRR